MDIINYISGLFKLSKGKNISLNKINKELTQIILPISVESLIQSGTGIVLMGLVGHLDVISITAIGVATTITQIIRAVFKGISIGNMVYVSRYKGEGNYNKLSRVIENTLISVIVFSILISIIVFLNTETILHVFTFDNQLIRKTEQYLRIVAVGFPFYAASVILSGTFQGIRRSATSMYINLATNIFYIAIAAVFIFSKIDVLPHGLNGAAFALVLSQAAAAVIGLFIIIKNKVLKVSLSKLRLEIKYIRDVYRIGIPAAMESVLWLAAIVIVTKVMLFYGQIPFSAYQLGVNAETISYMPADGFAIASTTLISQTYGEKNGKLAKIYLRQIIKGSILITAVCVLVFLFFPQRYITLLTNDKEIIVLSARYLFLMGFIEIPLNITSILIGAIRGVGFARIPIIISAAGLWGIRVPMILITTYVLKLSVEAAWMVIGIDIIFRFILSLILFIKKSSSFLQAECVSNAGN